MRLFVSAVLLAAASAAFAQNQTSGPTLVQILHWQGTLMDPSGQPLALTLDDSVRVPLAALADRGEKSTCFTMRSYRFSRPDPKSDATKWSGYSTCQAAGMLQMRRSLGPGR